MKIEIGKRYRRRDGLVSGTIVPSRSEHFPFMDAATGVTYTEHGTFDRQGRVAWTDDLVAPEVEDGDDLPDANSVTMSGADYSEMKSQIEMQLQMIERLRAAVVRKNKIMAEIMDLARYELAKEQG